MSAGPSLGWLQNSLKRFLGVSTVYKVLIANLALAIAGGATATLLAAALDDRGGLNVHWRLFWYLLAVGIPGAFLVNLAVLRLAFRPLSSLERTMEAVSQGDDLARAQEGLIADPQTSRMIATFNAMLDELRAARDHLSVLAARVVSAQEEERRRLSRELHDNAGQILTLAVLAVNAIRSAGGREETERRIDEAEAVLAQAAEEVRRAALELRPVMLDDFGLVTALEWYVQQSASAMGIPVKVHASGLERRLPPEIEVTVYRVIQEALTNVARHAKATKVSVSLSRQDDMLVAEVIDDGRGFDQRKAMRGPEATLGLFSMRERVATLGGRLTIESEPGKGTRILAEISLPAE